MTPSYRLNSLYLGQALGFGELLVDLLREVLLGFQKSFRHGGETGFRSQISMKYVSDSTPLL